MIQFGIYIYIYIYILMSVYFGGGKLLFKQVLLKTIEHYFFISFFQIFLLFLLRRDLFRKGIILYLLPKRFRPYLWSSSAIV